LTRVTFLVGVVAALAFSLGPIVVPTAHATVVTCGQSSTPEPLSSRETWAPCDDPPGAAALTVNGTAATLPRWTWRTNSLSSDNALAGFNASGGHNRVKSNTSGGNGQGGFALSGSRNKLGKNIAEANEGFGFSVGGDCNSAGANTATSNGEAGTRSRATRARWEVAHGRPGQGIRAVS
jgi:parallel beta-helix repeat protein